MGDQGDSGSKDREASPADSIQRRSSATTSAVNSQTQSVELPQPRRGLTQQSSNITYGSITARQPIASPDGSAPKSAKKPAFPRRATSHGPHRGQEFSVDDADYEVDLDLAEQIQQQQRQAKMATGTLRGPSSTLRRRPTGQAPSLPAVTPEVRDEEEEGERGGAGATTTGSVAGSTRADDPDAEEEEEDMGEPEEGVEDDEDDEDLSDAESFTLKDKQQAINQTHPFGIRIWKPALYKKSRSVQQKAEGDIHSTPGGFVSHWLLLFNFLWTIIFGWWLALLAAVGGVFCIAFSPFAGCREYGRVLFGLAKYLFYPFGKYIKLMQDEAYADEDEGEGRSISEYEQWQSGDIEEGRLFFGPLNGSLVGRRRNSVDSSDETQSLLGRQGRGSGSGSPNGANGNGQRSKRRLFGRGKWNLGRVIFFIFNYGLITPLLILVSGICWLLVFTIPMGRVTWLLVDHMRRRPLALSFHSDSSNTRRAGAPSSTILVCTYRAVGMQYWKYTVDGTNIFLINLLGIVAFTIFDYYVLGEALGAPSFITKPGFVFVLALFSIIPLAYFIGQAVASISAQSSMGVGATVNAFFATVVEVFLYCIALKEGKAQLVEGSIIGSIFAGILFLPGLSMCFGALKRKTQRFNVKSAGVTSTMLLFAVVAAFGPTLFYQIYGSHELNCRSCSHPVFDPDERDCRSCYFLQTPALNDRFYLNAVRPYTWFSAVLLFISYFIGLLFTLRTHAAVIWATEVEEKRPERSQPPQSMSGSRAGPTSHDGPNESGSMSATSITGAMRSGNVRDSQFYKRVLGQTLKQTGISDPNRMAVSPTSKRPGEDGQTVHVVPPRSNADESHPGSPLNEPLTSATDAENERLARHVAEVAVAAAVVAARDSARSLRKPSMTQLNTGSGAKASGSGSAREHQQHSQTTPKKQPAGEHMNHGAPHEAGEAGEEGGGHDAPNWSRAKSTIILLTATLAYAVIAEILVGTVDAVLDSVEIDEKFLGITLFALVPNTTEFLNAISFAMNGNIALSMEIGSAYALQVCLLQVPALVLFSIIQGQISSQEYLSNHVFTMVFPQWDMVTVILCVFLLSYTVSEGKSNYFKGSILILAYLVVVVGFYFSSFNDVDTMGVDPYDSLAIKGQCRNFATVGSGKNGRAGIAF